LHEVNLTGQGRVFNLILTSLLSATLQGALPGELAQGRPFARSAIRNAAPLERSIPRLIAKFLEAPKFAPGL
jgi:hypothetical protein